MRRGGLFAALMTVALTVVLAFLALPIVAIFVDVGPASLLSSLDDPTAIDALQLSLETSLLGAGPDRRVRHAGGLAARDAALRGRTAAITAIELPLILPPAVAGIGLLAALGPKGLLGPALGDAGHRRCR